jgi:PKD domain-containing protein
MFTSKFLTRVITLVSILMLALTSVQLAYAASPNNDNLANATLIPGVPFSTTVDITEATTEAGEPQFCWFMDRTAWYSFTPTQSMVLRASAQGSAIGANVNIFRSTGAGINNLEFLGCASFSDTRAFIAEAGQTYYLQVGPTFGEAGNVQVNLEQFIPPPPQGGFSYNPFDPSAFDTVQFCDNSYDPAGFGFQSFTWDFGDGANSIDNCASHFYGRDGDYTVQHTAKTIDGRTASSSQLVQVRTHDVAINKLVVPQTARVNQTKAISVDVTNKRYSDYVQVSLYKGLAGGGEQLVGTLTIYVPARATRPTTFKFSYTFTSQDAQVGKVTFRAEANIVNARDILPSDNNAIATTLVTK